MARPVRVDIANGWYHVSARGTDRRTIFTDDQEWGHFVELLEEMANRYKVRIHAYVLMGNYYHLHLNPVRIGAMGLGKNDRKAKGRGVQSASEETMRRRLKRLREYRWSSYRAYAGYASSPEWLTTEELLKRGGGRREYRHYVMEWVTQGRDAGVFEDARERRVLGSQAFVEELRRHVRKLTSDQPARRNLARLATMEAIIGTVESELGRRWKDFSETYGDPGRDLALYLARKRSGLTLHEIGARIGVSNYKAISAAVRRFATRVETDAACRRLVVKCLAKL